MRSGPVHQLTAAPHGRCTVCGQPLRSTGERYWIVEHPDGVHEACRQWEREPFPFVADLRHLRVVARLVRRAWRLVVRDGRWLASASQRWPQGARRVARQWHDRKRRLEHQLVRLKDRLG